MSKTNTVKDKSRERHLIRTYGITLSQYNQLLRKQNGVCAVCYKTPEANGRALAVDHAHGGPFKGEVRGLLCFTCNRYVIGRHTDPKLLMSASGYLQHSHTGWYVPEKKRKRKHY
jgi:hypothetical protein